MEIGLKFSNFSLPLHNKGMVTTLRLRFGCNSHHLQRIPIYNESVEIYCKWLWHQASHTKYHSHHSSKWSGSSVRAVKATCQQSTRRRSSRSGPTFSSKKAAAAKWPTAKRPEATKVAKIFDE